MKPTKGQKCLVVTVITVIFTAVGSSQVLTGTPPFQSFGGGPEVINLGNLNVHYSIPVFIRAGRGIPFSYALAYDSSVWAPAGSVWVPSSSTWGLTRDVPAAVGTVPVGLQQSRCTDPSTGKAYIYNIYRFSEYVDSAGSAHLFAATVNDNDGTCGATPTPTATVAINDGSGITMTVNSSPGASATLKSGATINVPVSISGQPTGPSTQTDSNGNKITSSTVSGTTNFYDTLDSATRALAITGTAPAPVSYTYTSPANTNASVVVTYHAYNVQTYFQCSGINEYGPISNNLVDRITLPDNSYYQFTYEKTPITGNNNVTGRIASVRLPTGGTISYTYTGPNNGIMCADGSTAGISRTTPDSATPWQYSRTGTSPNYTTAITDPDGNLTTINFSGNYETNRVVKDASLSELETVQTCYNASCVTAVTTPITQLNVYKSVGGVNSSQSVLFYNGYGLLTYDYEYGWNAAWQLQWEKTIFYNTTLGNGIVDRPSEILIRDSVANTKARTDYTYDENALQATTGTPNHGTVTGSRGNVTTIKSYVTGTTFLTRHLFYYDTGTPYQSQDVNGAMTTYTYGSGSCGNSFVTSVSLPLSLSRSMAWNCTGGVMTSATDENGQIVSTSYTDPDFWRLASTTDPLLNVTHFNYPSLTKIERYLNFNGTVSTVDVLTTLDSLGRPYLSQQKQSPASTAYDSVEQHYGSSGRPNWSSLPYAAAAGAFAPTGTPTVSTTFDGLGRLTETHDSNLARVTLTYPNLNDVYSSVTPAPTGENAKNKQLEHDSIGRLTSVCEITSVAGSGTCGQVSPATGYWTKYTYDSPTNSMKVTQSAQGGTAQTRTYQYDLLGRLTSETNPESSQTQYFYDTAPATPGVACAGTYNGDLVKKYDAQGNTICYAYDALHRLTSITYPAGPNSANTSEKHFVYDSAVINTSPPTTIAYAKGRLAEAYTGASTSKITDLGFYYNARGEVEGYYESTPHSGGYYTLCVRNWEHGALKSLNCLPGMPYLQYGAADGSGLDGEGRLTKVTAQSGQNPVTGVTYTNGGTTQPIGSVSQVTYGSSDSDNFQYDVNTGRLTQYKFNVGLSQAVTGNLTWNVNGTLATLGITDQVNTSNSQTCAYTYDDLARIATANCGASIWNQTFTTLGASYDVFGNLKKDVPPGSTGTAFLPTYTATTNHYASIPGASVSYDLNGNLTADGSHTYTWDAEGRPHSIDSVVLTYDALGRMIEQARGTSYTQVVYGSTGKLALMTGQTLVKGFAPLPGGGTAVYTPGNSPAYYRHGDWLGSSRLATTPTRTSYYDGAYAPFGENYVGSGTTELNFTGQNQDTVSGLYDFVFREYSPAHGRWISPDPAGLGAVSLANPQTWNRYAYVENNPLNAVDPLGLFKDDAVSFASAYDCFPLCIASTVYLVDGQATSAFLAQRMLSSGAAANCPSCYGYVNSPAPNGSCPMCRSVDATNTIWGWRTDISSLSSSASCNFTSCPGKASNPLITTLAYWGAIGTASDRLSGTCILLCGADGNDVFNRLYPRNPTTASISPVASPTEGQIEAACTYVAIQQNNGFGPGSSQTASVTNGIVFQQNTQYRRPTTMNPSAPNVNVLLPLAAPGIFVRDSYNNCHSQF